MDYSEEMFRLQAENEEHKAVLEKSHEILNQALEIIMPEDKRSREVVSVALSTSVQHFARTAIQWDTMIVCSTFSGKRKKSALLSCFQHLNRK